MSSCGIWFHLFISVYVDCYQDISWFLGVTFGGGYLFFPQVVFLISWILYNEHVLLLFLNINELIVYFLL